MTQQIMPSQASRTNRIIPIIIVVGVTLSLLFLMNTLKPKEEEKDDDKVIPLVEVISIQPFDYVVPIKTEGMVLPKSSISFSAEINGKITAISNEFTRGGEFNQGDVLVEIDPVDYQLAITRAQANVASAQASLDLEQAKSNLAKDDWAKYGKKGKPTSLNLNLPQVASAKAGLAGAKADLMLAQRNLEKTKIIAPFDGVVLSKNVDIGQYVNIGMSMAEIASIEFAEIKVALTDKQLFESGLMTSFQNIVVNISSEETKDTNWQGIVKNIEAQRNSQTLMNYVVVEIARPFTQQNIPIRFNSFVNVDFLGKTLKAVYPISRQYMLLNNNVKILNSQTKLLIQPVEVIYSDDEYFYVSKGFSHTDKLIITHLPNIKDGTQLELKTQI